MTSTQELLVQQLKHIFPKEKPIVNSRKESQIKYFIEGSHYLELDLWFPNHNICFEFQDEYHYVTTWYNQKSLSQVQFKDSRKRERVNKLGMNLIAIPCWWDGEIQSLSSTINFYSPQLLQEDSGDESLIPLNPTFEFFRTYSVPDVGSLMYVSFPESSSALEGNLWWMGEKYDGVRCCWNPLNRQLYSRFGNELDISLPSITSISNLTRSFLDGELWFGRNTFYQSFAVVKQRIEANNTVWGFMRVTAFDVPPQNNNINNINNTNYDYYTSTTSTTASINRPFEIRYETLLSSVPKNSPLVIVAPRILFQFSSSPKYFIQMIIDDGGEGIILRKVASLYQHGRSKDLLKLKTSTVDTEGIVVDISSDKVVTLQLPSGKMFKVKPENVHIRQISNGDIVSVSFENENSKDKDPKIYRLRTDVSWENVVGLYNKEHKRDLSDSSLRYLNMKSSSAKSGRRDLIKKMRNFMINFAKSKNLDPLQIHTWQKIKESEIKQHKRGKKILVRFKTIVAAAKFLFPTLRNIDLWRIAENRRKFFEGYAKVNGFDPLRAANWLDQPTEKILKTKGANQVLYYYNFSISRALQSLFPEIGLEKSKKWAVWHESMKIRKVFENYAKEQRFDPLVAKHWYQQPKGALLAMKGIGLVYSQYRDLSKALQELFPDIGIDPEKLVTTSWIDEKKRREFFENYARENGFDPLVATNWYSQSPKKIKSKKGASRIIAYHGNSVSKALLDLFPEIGLSDLKLVARSWGDATKRRRFFENFAVENGFDPLNPDNWYARSQNKLLATKGTRRIITFHQDSIAKALIDLFPEVNFTKTSEW